jgi:competence protein ComEC
MMKQGSIRLIHVLSAWIVGLVCSFYLPSLPAWPLWAGTAVLLAAVAWRFRIALLLLIVLGGAAWGVWSTERALAAQWPLSEQPQPVPLQIRVADLPQPDERRVRFVAQALDADGRAYRLQLSDYQQREWPPGSRWQITARVRSPVGELNGAGFDREAWALASGLDGSGTIGKERQMLAEPGWQDSWLLLRQKLSMSWQRIEGADDGAALMRALGLGEQNALPQSAWQAFRPLGLNHLVSISGLHISMVALMAAWLTNRLLRLSPRLPQRPRSVVLLVGLLAATGYTALAGFPVPALRSLGMLTVFACLWWRRGSQSAWLAWWLALAAVLTVYPPAALGVGTWLSFGLVGALLWSGSWRLQERGWKIAVRAQWAATLMTVVLVGERFSAIPLLSPLVNALAIPWFSWVLTPLALLASFLPFYPLQWLAAHLAQYTMNVLYWLTPYAPEWGVAAAPWPLWLLAIAAVLVILLPRGLALKPLAWLILAGFLLYRPPKPLPGEVRITVWDIGQGLAVSMETQNHKLLYDTATVGMAQMNLIPNLHAQGWRRLDALVLSHHDNDHAGGFDAVTAAFQPETIWAGQPEFYSQAQLCADDIRWQWDGVHFEFLRPTGTFKADNDQSCVLRVVANGQALLLTGDLGFAGEQALVAQYGDDLYSQVLVLGHHGSASSSAAAFLDAVSPRWAIASSGFANHYRHPSAATQARLKTRNIELLRTDYRGAWRIEMGSQQEPRVAPLVFRQAYWYRKPFYLNLTQ